jgi:hypothetical protein
MGLKHKEDSPREVLIVEFQLAGKSVAARRGDGQEERISEDSGALCVLKSADFARGELCFICAGHPKEEFRGGIKLIPKDLRDFFGTEIAARVKDPSVIMKLLRHTSLETTTKYLRTVNERLEVAVQTLGASLGGNSKGESRQKTAQNDTAQDFSVTPKSFTNHENDWEKVGGGGRSRTYDAADMSRVL